MLLRLYEVKKLKRHSRSILVSLITDTAEDEVALLAPRAKFDSVTTTSLNTIVIEAVLNRESTCIHTTLSMAEVKAYDKMSKEERDVHDQQQREKEEKEQAGELLHFLGPVLV